MQFTNIYIMVNTQTYTSCVNRVKKNKKTLNFFIACKFVMACDDKNEICDSTIQKKNEEKSYMMMWRIIPRHINLGPRISMS
jgi:hypothetical protein